MKLSSIARVLGLAAVIVAGACESAPMCEPTKPAPAPPPPPPPAPMPVMAPKPCAWPTKAPEAKMNWVAMAYPTGDAKTSAVGIEKGVPREVFVGDNFDFMLVVTNITACDLDNVMVTEEFGDNFNYHSSTPAGTKADARTVKWALGSLKPCESKVINIKGTATAKGTISGCTNVSYSSYLCAPIIAVKPDLKLVVTGPAEVTKCDTITYNFELSNPGTGTATGIKIKDKLPDGLSNASGGNMIEIDVGSIGGGQTKKYTAMAKPEKIGNYSYKAKATGDGALAAESGVISTKVTQSVLKIERNCPGLRYLGREVEVAITVSNAGDTTAKGVTVTDSMSMGKFVSADSGGVAGASGASWNVGDLAPGAKKTVNVVYSTGGPGSYEGKSTAMAACADTVNASCKTEVKGVPGLMLNGFDNPDPVELGKTVTYTLVVTNQGTAPLTQVSLVCTMEESGAMEFVSATGVTPGGNVTGTASGKTINFPVIASIGPKEEATYKVVVKAVKAGQVQLKAVSKSAEITLPLEKIETTNFYK